MFRVWSPRSEDEVEQKTSLGHHQHPTTVSFTRATVRPACSHVAGAIAVGFRSVRAAFTRCKGPHWNPSIVVDRKFRFRAATRHATARRGELVAPAPGAAAGADAVAASAKAAPNGFELPEARDVHVEPGSLEQGLPARALEDGASDRAYSCRTSQPADGTKVPGGNPETGDAAAMLRVPVGHPSTVGAAATSGERQRVWWKEEVTTQVTVSSPVSESSGMGDGGTVGASTQPCPRQRVVRTPCVPTLPS